MNVMLTQMADYQQKAEHTEDQPARNEEVEEPDLRVFVHRVRMPLRRAFVNG